MAIVPTSIHCRLSTRQPPALRLTTRRTTPGSAPAGHRTRRSSAPHLLLERNACRDTAAKPDVVVHLAADQHRAALNDAHRNAAARFSRRQSAGTTSRMNVSPAAAGCRLMATHSPSASSWRISRGDSERAVHWCCYVESLVASSIRHHLQVGKGHAARVFESAMRPWTLWRPRAVRNVAPTATRCRRFLASISRFLWPWRAEPG